MDLKDKDFGKVNNVQYLNQYKHELALRSQIGQGQNKCMYVCHATWLYVDPVGNYNGFLIIYGSALVVAKVVKLNVESDTKL